MPLTASVEDSTISNNHDILMTTVVSEGSLIYKVAGTMLEGKENTELSEEEKS